MIAESLISEDVWSDAPEDPEEAFLFIAIAANRRLQSMRDDEGARGPFDYNAWRRQYIWELSAVADSLGIDGLPSPATATANSGTMADFDAYLARAITKIRVLHRADLRADSVALALQTKEDIRSHLEELRGKINNSNLSEKLRSALHKKVDAVEAEIDRSRSSLKPFWILAGAVAAAAPVTVGTLADLPDAVQTVNKVVEAVHSEKAAEDESERRKTSLSQIEQETRLQITDQSEKPEGKRGSQKR